MILLQYLNISIALWVFYYNCEYKKSIHTWGIIVNFDLKLCRPIFEISISSINIVPVTGSIILNNAKVIEDFPAPVRPIMPT